MTARSSAASRSSSAASDLPRVPAERQAGVLPGDRVPRAGADHEHRERDRLGAREVPPAAVALGQPPVGEHRPRRVGDDAQRDRGLEVVLVEAREDPLGHVHAEVGRGVGLAVGRVGHQVHPVAVGDVGQPRRHDHLVAPGEPGQQQPAAVVRRLGALPVDLHLDVGRGGQLQEGLGGRGGEADDRAHPVATGVRCGEVQLEVVGHVGEGCGPGAGLGEGEGHLADSRADSRAPPRLARRPTQRLGSGSCLGEGMPSRAWNP